MTKIAVITGGSRGLGRNTAMKLAREGCGIVLTYHTRRTDADDVVSAIEAAGGRAAALQLDTGDTTQFAAFRDALAAALRDTWGRDSFDYLVNNAGHGIHASIAETTEADFDSLMNVHLKGVFFLTQTLLPMIEEGGRIVNLSSGLARFTFPGYAAYAAMKGAVEVFTRYLAQELGPRGIAVNTIAPGAIETDFGGGVVRDVEAVNQMVAAATAMGRAGQPDDIGDAIASLLTGGSQWITGQRIEVSGGQNL
ncbi:MAG: SDR family oxidoreductase [Rhodobacteraceae bacterium]|nr:SDR family oxidoreductase [Paracoccaceae bacterium]